MDTITSTQNQKVKWIRALQNSSRTRKQEGYFVIEGVRLVEEALDANWPAAMALFSPSVSERGEHILTRLSAQGMEVIQAADNVMKAASDTETPQGVLVVLKQLDLPLPENPDFLFIADQVRDPGNLGTMARSALAAGVNGILLPPGTVDPFSPKVVRAGMGAHFRLPIHVLSWAEIEAQTADLKVFLATANQGMSYSQADFLAPLALIVGSEAEGAGTHAGRLAEQTVHIPMPGGSESLNASIAAAVLFFEVVRQRIQSRPG